MGTNFYYKIPLKPREKKELQDMLTDYLDFSEMAFKLDELEKTHRIHLGKRSYGWQFLWDFHKGKYYPTRLNKIREWLEKSGGVIVDEYNEQFTVDQFLDDEIKDCLYKDENHCDAESYHQKHPEDPYCSNYRHEFIQNGLRFSIHEDFS